MMIVWTMIWTCKEIFKATTRGPRNKILPGLVALRTCGLTNAFGSDDFASPRPTMLYDLPMYPPHHGFP